MVSGFFSVPKVCGSNFSFGLVQCVLGFNNFLKLFQVDGLAYCFNMSKNFSKNVSRIVFYANLTQLF